MDHKSIGAVLFYYHDVVTLSSLRAITFVSTPLRSVATHIHRPYTLRGHHEFGVNHKIDVTVSLPTQRVNSTQRA
jgi:hypothetical protein